MSKFFDKFSDSLMVVAEKIEENRFLTAIKNSFSTFLPFIIVASFASLFNTLLCNTEIGLARFIPELTSLAPAFTAVNFAGLSFMTIPIIFLIGLNLAKMNKTPEYLTGILAVLAFVALAPQTVQVTLEGLTGEAGGLGAATLGAQSLFFGMILAVVVAELFSLLTKIKILKIKMPDSVPLAISTSFNTLLPIGIILIGLSLFGAIFTNMTGSYINDFVYSLIQAPMEAIFQSPAGIIGLAIFMQFFWLLGIHGGLVISPVRNPLFAIALAANIAAVNAGGVASQPVTMGFWVAFVTASGNGIMLSVLIAIFLFSKREDHRAIAKATTVTTLFGISEPVIFGLPLVMNPTFAIPFIFSSGVATAIAMFATNIGFLPCNIVDAPMGLPVIISAFVGHGWQGIVVQIIIFIVVAAMYTPFVLLSNKQYVREQEKLAEQSA